jgi:hypothetical protein
MDIQRVGAQELDVSVVPADIFEQDTTDPKNPVLHLRDWLLDIHNLKVESADIGTLQTTTYQKVSALETRIDDASTFRNGLIIPMYIYPTDAYTNSSYNGLAQLKRKYRDIPFVVVLNPSNGPGTVTDGNYTLAINMLRGAGCIVVGYVSTLYTNRPIQDVESDISLWKSLYPNIQGIFFDEQSDGTTDITAEQSYYESLVEHTKTAGLTYTIGNAGIIVDNSWYDIFTIEIEWENSTYPSEIYYDGPWPGGKKLNKRALLKYASSSFESEMPTISSMLQYYKFVYITTDTLPNPWDSIDITYLEKICDAITSPQLSGLEAVLGSPLSTTSLQAYYSFDEVLDVPDDTSGVYYRLASPIIDTTNYGFATVNLNAYKGQQITIVAKAGQGSVKGTGIPRAYVYATDWSWAPKKVWNYVDPQYDSWKVTIPNDTKNYAISWYHYPSGSTGNSSLLDFYIGTGAYSTPLINNTKDSLYGTIYGATKTGGINGNALSFDGVDDKVVLPNHSDLKPTAEVSVSVWINIDSTTDHDLNYAVLCGRDNSSGYMLYYSQSAGKIYAKVWGSSAVTISSAITTNTWHHVAFTYKNGTGLALYLDGVQVATGASVGAITYTELDGGYPTIGSHGLLYYFKGIIDEMLIFSRAISFQEVKGLYYQKTSYKNSPYTNEAILARRLKLQTVSVNTTLSTESNIIEVVTADAVTLTIPSGLPLGHQYRIKRTISSANGISVVPSGSETIEATTSFTVQGTKVSAMLDTGEVVLEKVSSTAWAFVGGQVSGSNSSGTWMKFSDGTMICSFIGTVYNNTVTPSKYANYGDGHVHSVYLGNGLLGATIYYPTGFASGTKPDITCQVHANDSGGYWWGQANESAYTNTSWNPGFLWSYSPNNINPNISIYMTAVGRWKS